MSTFALIDLNSAFASIEQIFRPDLQGKAVVVFSLNDANIIARSPAAKPLVEMGAAYHEARAAIEQHQIAIFSANYRLYLSLSSRFLALLTAEVGTVEPYSIDESFLDLDAIPGESRHEFADRLVCLIERHLNLPAAIGVATTKTLAKLANKRAKKRGDRVCVLETPEEVTNLLRETDVEDVWGIGPSKAAVMRSHGIFNAYQLTLARDAWIKAKFTIVTLRTALELRGISCLPIENAPSARKQIFHSRAFGRPITTQKELQKALSYYVCRAAETLRAQHSLVRVLSCSLSTNSFRANEPQYHDSVSISLPRATNDSRELVEHVRKAAAELYRPGFQFHRAGVWLTELIPDTHRQLDFETSPEDMAQQQSVNNIIDAINARFGAGTIYLAAQGHKQEWGTKAAWRSKNFTSCWADLPEAW